MAQPVSSTRCLTRSLKRLKLQDSTQCSTVHLRRSYATHAELPSTTSPQTTSSNPSKPDPTSLAARFQKDAIVTLHSWPSMEPVSFKTFRYHQLNLPLRRDILHRAVVWEGDASRSGTANTKHRTQVQGSMRKVRPQKGTGHARLSDARAPHLRGGGVVHGPRARDFGTELPSKMYDLAYRTALSYRYNRGELIVLQNEIGLSPEQGPRWFDNFFQTHEWGRKKGRTMLISARPDEDTSIESAEGKMHAINAMLDVSEHGKMQWETDADVKDILSSGRIIIEQEALERLLTTSNVRHNFLESRALSNATFGR